MDEVETVPRKSPSQNFVESAKTVEARSRGVSKPDDITNPLLKVYVNILRLRGPFFECRSIPRSFFPAGRAGLVPGLAAGAIFLCVYGANHSTDAITLATASATRSDTFPEPSCRRSFS